MLTACVSKPGGASGSRPPLTALDHLVERTLIRASQTENSPGDRIGLLNHLFNALYRVRLVGKAIKQKSRVAHCSSG